MKVDAVSQPPDAGITVFSDGGGLVALRYYTGWVRDIYGQGAPFEPGLFHTFELRSSDMQQYALYIDDALAWTDTFHFSGTASEVAWGEDTVGAASLTHWDYVGYGVVPEPRGAVIVLAGIMLACFRPGRIL